METIRPPMTVTAIGARKLPSPDKVEEAFVRVCEALGVPATAGAYLEVPRLLAAAREMRRDARIRSKITVGRPS